MWRYASLIAGLVLAASPVRVSAAPNFVLVMADDQGWGETGYSGHPVLKTPNLDAMAANGLRFDRFYAGAPNCSPTRATVLTGRTNDRCGVRNHGYALRPQERTLAQALGRAGFATGHFGKWHLSGFTGSGAPVLASDERNPGRFGFGEWLSVTNYFDRDPVLSRQGEFEAFEGDSSEVVVEQALEFMRRTSDAGQPFLAVVWFGSPHDPWRASDEDRAAFAGLPPKDQNHFGELVAMDRAIGRLRAGLREFGVADDTLVWFCSDNGGLRPFGPATVGGLRGWKNSLFEGGLRVPAVIEWPARIRTARVTNQPASTLDIFPTIAEIVGLPDSDRLQPQDGLSLVRVIDGDDGLRPKPIPFRHGGRAAWIDNDLKLVTDDLGRGPWQLYDLATDPTESRDLAAERPDALATMRAAFEAWNKGVEASVAGLDYPEGRVIPDESPPVAWPDDPAYAPHLEELARRPEFRFLRKRLQPAGEPPPEPSADQPDNDRTEIRER